MECPVCKVVSFLCGKVFKQRLGNKLRGLYRGNSSVTQWVFAVSWVGMGLMGHVPIHA